MSTSQKPSSILSPLRRQRMAWRLAQGFSVEETALNEGFTACFVEKLLDDSEFVMLVDGFRNADTLSQEDRLSQLTELAWMVLEEAILQGDPRVSASMFAEHSAKRRSPRRVAGKVSASGDKTDPAEANVPAGLSESQEKAKAAMAADTGSTRSSTSRSPIQSVVPTARLTRKRIGYPGRRARKWQLVFSSPPPKTQVPPQQNTDEHRRPPNEP